MNVKRGAFIVLEGVDRTGKSTQCRALAEGLTKKQIQAENMNFPARDTEIGKMINGYLTSKQDLSDEVIHLLFSANRWECAKKIIQTLNAGISLVVDRYCFSGVAFTAAKGFDINWCKAPDVGLPKPDKVFFLTMPLDQIQQRSGYGGERYEKLDFQKKVLEKYMQLKDDSWEIVDANRPIATIQEQLLEKSLTVINSVHHVPIAKVWTST
ncbi:thymidylate kinase [Hyposmocoma kahamanoa]|uniref:thymidylate kinase n=1 Tax=Hyposmocoma kahamanoa TaxID=1477025 RepID=UPI000E6D7DA2|nr:thymidylate kinase [Hyposmocoma kahamanoa]